MKIDVDLSAALEVSAVDIAEIGIDKAIQKALDKLNFVIDGYAYLPESWDNLEKYEDMGINPDSDGFYFNAENIMILKEGQPNKQNKDVLEKL